jgi:hypothetical protein
MTPGHMINIVLKRIEATVSHTFTSQFSLFSCKNKKSWFNGSSELNVDKLCFCLGLVDDVLLLALA